MSVDVHVGKINSTAAKPVRSSFSLSAGLTQRTEPAGFHAVTWRLLPNKLQQVDSNNDCTLATWL